MKKNTSTNILLFLLGFLSLGALFGGAIFIISPNGDLFKMPLSYLNNSPFSNYLIPGIVLFVTLGILPAFVILGLLKKSENRFAQFFNYCSDMHWAWTCCIYISFILILWIQFEIIFIKTINWSHTFYVFYAIAIIFMALLPQVRNLYKK